MKLIFKSWFLLSKFFIRWHDARRGFNSTQLKNEEVMSGDYQASGRQDSATSDSSNSFFIDTNRAQLPRGIRQVRIIHYLLHKLIYFKTLNRVFVKKKNVTDWLDFFQIRPHLENMDNVPLLVSLFTDCDSSNTREMIVIMQDYGEVVCVLGSSANHANVSFLKKIFVKSNVNNRKLNHHYFMYQFLKKKNYYNLGFSIFASRCFISHWTTLSPSLPTCTSISSTL